MGRHERALVAHPTRSVRGYYFAVNPFDPRDWAGRDEVGVGRWKGWRVSTQRAVYRAKKWPMAGKARGEVGR